MRARPCRSAAIAALAVVVTQCLARGEGTLGKMLTDDSLYRDAQDAIRTVQRSAQGVEDQAPISVLSTLASSLF